MSSLSGMNISRSNTTRLTGLMSGLDVDELVKGMTAKQQSQLDKAIQKQTLLSWKKDAYRSAITTLSDFQSKFLDILNPASITKPSNFKSIAVSVSEAHSKFVSVSSSSTTSDIRFADIKIKSIISLASEQKITSVAGNAIAPRSVDMKMAVNGFDAIAGKSFTINLDGKSETIKLPTRAEFDAALNNVGKAPGTFDHVVFEDLMNDQLAKFGFGVGGSPKVIFTASEHVSQFNNQATGLPDVEGYDFSFTAAAGSNITVSASDAAVSTVLKFQNGASTILDKSKSVGEIFGGQINRNGSDTNKVETSDGNIKFSINDLEFTFSANAKLSDVITAVNKSAAGVNLTYSEVTDKFSIVSTSTGTGENIRMKDLSLADKSGTMVETNLLRQMFGQDASSYTTGSSYDIGSNSYGSDAIFNVNGETLYRKSNTNTIDGVSVTLNAVTEANTGDIAVSIKTDASATVQTVMNFVEGYNELIDNLNKILNESRPKTGRSGYYLPLTDAEKKDMSESEIKQWEEWGKTGLLKHDTTIERMATTLRNAIVNTVTFEGYDPKNKDAGVKLSLSSIGITTMSYTQSSIGKLQIDEAKLTAAIESDPEGVSKLFLNTSSISKTATGVARDQRYAETGLSTRISEIFSSNISTSYMSEGALIKIAGTGGANSLVDLNSSISRQSAILDTSISRMRERLYAAEETAYAKFAALETMIAKMSEQSSYLFGQQAQ
ncbi:hypothetical protein FACS1894105_12080 [Clostridia bacterium]|nr:hypothetical protein FACS1894105_12080 [Clostridia bacterium]